MSKVIAERPFTIETTVEMCDFGDGRGIRGVEFTYKHFRETDVQCDCGRVLTCVAIDFTTTCECGRDYDGNGNLLAPRSQWGEETGESYGDIVRGEREDW